MTGELLGVVLFALAAVTLLTEYRLPGRPDADDLPEPELAFDEQRATLERRARQLPPDELDDPARVLYEDAEDVDALVASVKKDIAAL